ncbi:hypothetical protein [Rhizobium leguminosarum]|uniref:hypothetical protein n=1 Tax=Rhizobium leguminosarum TaxID=384 RepID=UPI001C953FCC|nr:hypothetical protein [Rhizobium leguminosarum]MBY5612732.1 hypothetical protein [Rhizobium leguminosarum]MBY5659661.1 hypothetical protein [Rhizobium leguminosarum]
MIAVVNSDERTGSVFQPIEVRPVGRQAAPRLSLSGFLRLPAKTIAFRRQESRNLPD